MKIIVVDDDSGIRELIKETLEQDGYDILEASDGVEGLQLITTKHPDLIIADINMPKMNGDEMFRRLRQNETDLEVIPFIFLSGNVNDSEKIKRLDGGANGCFEKPIEMDLLRAHVNSCLSNIRRHSAFMKRKLDLIASSLPETTKHDFSSYKSLRDNVDEYSRLISESIRSQLKKDCTTNTNSRSISKKKNYLQDNFGKPLNYIRFCLSQIETQRQLIKTKNSVVLTWWLIFTVAESQYTGEKLFVSDLYVSAPAAKTTINSRINMLIEEGILLKNTHDTDGRRQSITLTKSFEVTLNHHIHASIRMIQDGFS